MRVGIAVPNKKPTVRDTVGKSDLHKLGDFVHEERIGNNRTTVDLEKKPFGSRGESMLRVRVKQLTPLSFRQPQRWSRAGG